MTEIMSDLESRLPILLSAGSDEQARETRATEASRAETPSKGLELAHSKMRKMTIQLFIAPTVLLMFLLLLTMMMTLTTAMLTMMFSGNTFLKRVAGLPEMRACDDSSLESIFPLS